jgi:hypothetical protein
LLLSPLRDFFNCDGKTAQGTDFLPGGLGAVSIDNAGIGFPLGVKGLVVVNGHGVLSCQRVRLKPRGEKAVHVMDVRSGSEKTFLIQKRQYGFLFDRFAHRL